MLRTFLKLKTLHLIVLRGQRMWYTAGCENNSRRLRLLKITLSLKVAGSLSAEWDVLEQFSASGALILASGSIIEAMPPIPFPHRHQMMHIRRGGTLKHSDGTINNLESFNHLLKVDEVVGLEAQGPDIEDIYDPDCEDIYDVIEG